MRERREERQEERATFGRGGDATRFQVRQNLVSIGDDFRIKNDRGERLTLLSPHAPQHSPGGERNRR
jgi:hypothetical protein